MRRQPTLSHTAARTPYLHFSTCYPDVVAGRSGIHATPFADSWKLPATSEIHTSAAGSPEARSRLSVDGRGISRVVGFVVTIGVRVVAFHNICELALLLRC